MEGTRIADHLSGPRRSSATQGDRRTPGRVRIAMLCLAGMLLLVSRALADDDNPCFACHGEKTFTTKRGNRTVSLYVDAKKFSSSVHGSLTCTGCHADLEGKELPHDVPLAKVECGRCHDSEQKDMAE